MAHASDQTEGKSSEIEVLDVNNNEIEVSKRNVSDIEMNSLGSSDEILFTFIRCFNGC